MNLTNYHSHCSFCDGKASMEDFVLSAISEGFIAYGISSHAPQPFESGCNMSYEDMPAYLAEFNRLKEKYCDRIELYVGLEIDYLDELNNPANDYFQHLPLDYRIGSVHYIPNRKGELIDIDAGPEYFSMVVKEKFDDDLESLISSYFKASIRMVETGGFDFIGHSDKIHRNVEYLKPGLTGSSWYVGKLREYFSYVAKQNVMVEINTKTYLAKGVFFPDQSVFPILKEMKIPVLVNSDTHRPEFVNAGRSEALEALKRCGIENVCQLIGGKWKTVPIG